MGLVIRLLLAAVVVTTLAAVAVAVLGGSDDEPEADGEAPFRTTPLDAFDTTMLTVARASFCDSVDPRQVEAALGGEPVDAETYDNGDQVTIAAGVEDVAHEFGCTWSLDDGSEARAWVFAPPVDRERAERLAREASRTDGCEPVQGPAYGDPTVALLCADGSLTSASFRGLMGDAWLTCELVAPAPDGGTEELVDRTGAWCVGVAQGASGTA